MSSAIAISMSTVVVASDQQISCDVADEAVLLSVQSGDYFGLNPVAASIWRRIERPCTLAEVRNALLEEYEGIEVQDCEHEVVAFVTQMLALDLVEIRPSLTTNGREPQ